MHDIDPRIDSLIDAYIDHTIEGAQFETLCDWLREDAEHRRAFTRRLAMHSAITEWCIERSGEQLAGSMMDRALKLEDVSAVLALLRESEDAADSVAVTIHDGRDWASPALSNKQWHGAFSYLYEHYATPRVIGGIGAVAALLLGLVLTIVLLDGPDENEPIADQVPPETEHEVATNPIVATLTAERDAAWDQTPSGDHRPGVLNPDGLRPGTPLAAGQRLTLTQGFAEITTGQGAVAVLEAPCQIELLGDNSLYLHRGKLLGICRTESSKGFLVKTLFAEVEDLGTEFGIEAHEGKVTTTVFTGKVEMTPEGGRAQPLIQNQTARLDAEVDVQALVVEDRLATGFDTLRTRPALPPIERWQQHLAELDRSHGLIGQLSFDANGVVATPGTDATFDAKLVGGTIQSGDETQGTAAALLINSDSHGVDLHFDPEVEHKQLTLVTWMRINPMPGQDISSLWDITAKKDAKLPVWHLRYEQSTGDAYLYVGQLTTLLASQSTGLEIDPDLKKQHVYVPQAEAGQGHWRCYMAVLDTQTRRVEHYINGKHIGASESLLAIPISLDVVRVANNASRFSHRNRHINGECGLFLVLDQALSKQQIEQVYQSSAGLFVEGP